MTNSYIHYKTTVVNDNYLFRKPKKEYKTAEEAIEVAKLLNKTSTSKFKVKAYHCLICDKYHVGKGNKLK